MTRAWWKPWETALAPASVLLALLVAASLADIPRAAASGMPYIQFAPAGGPPGTAIQAQIWTWANQATPFRLYATRMQPDRQQCSQPQLLPGVPILTSSAASEAPVPATFSWPGGQFTSGAWWLCARAVKDGALISVSIQPFLAALTPPTPLPTATALAQVSAAIEGPTTGLLPGTTLTIDVANWDANNQLTQAQLIPGNDVTVTDNSVSSPLELHMVGQIGPGAFAFQLTLPPTLPSGSYYILLQGAPYGQIPTQTFTVGSVGSGGPVASPPANAAVPAGMAVVGVGVALLLVAAIGLLATPAARRLLRR